MRPIFDSICKLPVVLMPRSESFYMDMITVENIHGSKTSAGTELFVVFEYSQVSDKSTWLGRIRAVYENAVHALGSESVSLWARYITFER